MASKRRGPTRAQEGVDDQRPPRNSCRGAHYGCLGMRGCEYRSPWGSAVTSRSEQEVSLKMEIKGTAPMRYGVALWGCVMGNGVLLGLKVKR